MDHKLALVFISFGFSLMSCSHASLFEYHYINLTMNWTVAQQYCRETFTDLATIENMEDNSKLIRPNMATSLAWIGLNDDPVSWQPGLGKDVNSWRWSATGETSTTNYKNWQYGQPNDCNGNQFCVAMNVDGTWNDENCDYLAPFVCYTVNSSTGQNTYVAITNLTTWGVAQAYCRTYYKDLATIANAQQNSEISSLMGSHNVWFGLYRVPWKWSDKSVNIFTNWQTGRPNTAVFCATEASNHFWQELNCSTEISFWCHRALEISMTTLRMKIQTDADLSDPGTNAQLLQQLGAVVKQALPGNVQLMWKIQPWKQEEIVNN